MHHARQRLIKTIADIGNVAQKYSRTEENFFKHVRKLFGFENYFGNALLKYSIDPVTKILISVLIG